MKSLLAIVITFFHLTAFAATPTIEGLFRNVSNPDIETDTVKLSFSADQKEGEESGQTSVKKNHYFEIFLKRGKEDNFQALQVEYEDSGLTKVKNVVLVENLKAKVASKSEITNSMFYSIVASIGLNNSEVMSRFLKAHAPSYRDNRAILNRGKLELLAKYRNYLKMVKGNKDLSKDLDSPLNPKSQDEKERIQALRNEDMYRKSEHIKLVRIKKDFFWQVELEDIKALYTNEKQQFNKMEMKSSSDPLTIIAEQYILFDGTHELPKLMLVKHVDGVVYNLKLTKYATLKGAAKPDLASVYKDKKAKALKPNVAKSEQLPFLFY